MKKKIVLILFIICSLFSVVDVHASTNTRERTEENGYLIPEKVPDLNEYKKSNAMMTPSVDEKEKIYDFADLFTDEEEQELFDEVSEFIEEYKYDCVIVTINENNKYSETEYADDFYDYNYFGEDGVLFLIDMQNRQLHITGTGKGQKTYSDGRIDNILDGMYQYITDARYYDGTLKVLSYFKAYSTIDTLDGHYKVVDGEIVEDYSYILWILGISAVVTAVVIGIMVAMNSNVAKANSSRGYLKNDTLKVNRVGEIFLGRHVTKTEKVDSSSSGHSGSSGISHSGGSHGF